MLVRIFKSVHIFTQVTSRLFDIMSGQSDIDHPLCEECTDTLLDQLDQQLKISEDEIKDYREFLTKLNKQKAQQDESALSHELSKLKKEEADLVARLEAVERERKQVAEAMEKERDESKRLEEEEKRLAMEYSEYQKELFEFEDEQQRLV